MNTVESICIDPKKAISVVIVSRCIYGEIKILLWMEFARFSFLQSRK